MQCGAEEGEKDKHVPLSLSLENGVFGEVGSGGCLGEEKFFSSDTTNGFNTVGVTSICFISQCDPMNSQPILFSHIYKYCDLERI
jgi:hypothetical protein